MVAARRLRLDALLADLAHARRQAEDEEVALRVARDHAANVEVATQLVQEVAKTIQESAHQKVASLVTRCLRAVGFDYDFVIRFDKRRGKTEAVLTFVRDGHALEDPLNEAGGGCTDIAAFALRLACLMLAKPQRRRLLLMDEPMKNVNGEAYQEKVGSLLETLARDFGIQFVIVSDDDWLKTGKVICLDGDECNSA